MGILKAESSLWDGVWKLHKGRVLNLAGGVGERVGRARVGWQRWGAWPQVLMTYSLSLGMGGGAEVSLKSFNQGRGKA